MSGIAVELYPRGAPGSADVGIDFRLLHPPPGIQNAALAMPFSCPADDPMFTLRPQVVGTTLGPGAAGAVADQPDADAPVLAAGRRLLESLAASAPVAEAMRQTLAVDAGASRPIYLKAADLVDALPWETLHDQARGFLALDGRWPIARLPELSPGERAERVLDPPLRIVSVLSALGVQAQAEWDGLYQAVQQAGLDLRMRVLVCEDDLATRIRGLPGAGEQESAPLRVSYLASKQQLLDEVASFQPHLIHFFCHGSASRFGPPYLELATRRAWQLNLDDTITLEPLELAKLGERAWLVTLNCCEGARAAPTARSIAATMVSAGVPAVVAMREPIAVEDANRFCGAFYAGALGELREVLGAGGDQIELEWARSLNGPRQALRDALSERHRLPPTDAAALHHEWTLPVLYVSAEATTLRRLAAPPPADRSAPAPGTSEQREAYLRNLLSGLLQARSGLHADTPRPILDAIDEQIRGVTAELYPTASRDPAGAPATAATVGR